MYHWIQIPEEESNALEKQGAVASNSDYGYKNFEGQNMVEYRRSQENKWKNVDEFAAMAKRGTAKKESCKTHHSL
jgi:trehalose-6-phosphatase